jgi:hypothetical protein
MVEMLEIHQVVMDVVDYLDSPCGKLDNHRMSYLSSIDSSKKGVL